MKRSLVLLAVHLSMVFTFLAPAPLASAATAENCTGSSSSFLGFPTWYKYLDYQFTEGECRIDFDVSKDVPKILLAIFEILLRVAGMAAVIFVIVGGFQYILTQGEPDKAKAAKGTIINALIGLVIAMSAAVIVSFLARTIV